MFRHGLQPTTMGVSAPLPDSPDAGASSPLVTSRSQRAFCFARARVSSPIRRCRTCSSSCSPTCVTVIPWNSPAYACAMSFWGGNRTSWTGLLCPARYATKHPTKSWVSPNFSYINFTSNRSRGCCLSMAATSLPPYSSGVWRTGTVMLAANLSCAACVRLVDLGGSSVPRKTKFTSTFTVLSWSRMNNFASLPSADFLMSASSLSFSRRPLAWSSSWPMAASASARLSAWLRNTTSMSTDSRGMSCTNRFKAVPPFMANACVSNTAGAARKRSCTVFT